jgi:hypothetical protein
LELGRRFGFGFSGAFDNITSINLPLGHVYQLRTHNPPETPEVRRHSTDFGYLGAVHQLIVEMNMKPAVTGKAHPSDHLALPNEISLSHWHAAWF